MREQTARADSSRSAGRRGLAAGTAIIGLLLTMNGGVFAVETDMSVPGPWTIETCHFADANHGIVVGTYKKTRHRPALKVTQELGPGTPIAWTADGGKTWEYAQLDADLDGTDGSGAWMVDANTGFALVALRQTRTQRLFKTTDGGRTFKTIDTSRNITGLRAVSGIWFDKDGLRGWLNPSVGEEIYKTIDGGVTWTAVKISDYQGDQLMAGKNKVPRNCEHQGMHVFSTDSLILAGQAGAFFRTDDGGKTWKASQVTLEPDKDGVVRGKILGVHFASGGKIGWAVGDEGELIRSPGYLQREKPVVLRTTNGGETWERVAIDVKAPLKDVWAISAQEAWVCGPYGMAFEPNVPGTLYRTTDGGKTWTDENPGNLSLYDLCFVDPRHGWAVGGQGGIISVCVAIRSDSNAPSGKGGREGAFKVK